MVREIPDLKAIINKFKMQNSGVQVRKGANFRVEAVPDKQQISRLFVEQNEAQLENERL
jgi:hypothetical protein